jgi:hypothetical protein
MEMRAPGHEQSDPHLPGEAGAVHSRQPARHAGAIDTAGRLITGERFADVQELAAVIAGPRRRDFHRCLAEKLLTYALGRGVEYFDAPAVDTILEQAGADGRLDRLVQGVVMSVPFQMRRSPAATGPVQHAAPHPAAEGRP